MKDSNSNTDSTDGTKNIDQKLKELSDEMIEKMNAGKLNLWRIKQRLFRWIYKGPRKEVSHDWHIVKSYLDRAIENYRIRHGDKHHDDSTINTLAQINAYLQLAKNERDFAKAWTYVNIADSLLPLVVNDEELEACTARLRSRDSVIPGSMIKSLPKDMKKLLNKKKPGKSQNTDRYGLLSVQEIRALIWNNLNCKIALRISLWRSLGTYLFIGLVTAIIVAEFLNTNSIEPNPLVMFPFFAISLLGFFGGGISAFLRTRKKVVDITSYQTLKVYTVLRMLLGAAGSFVVFVAVNWLGNQDIVDLLGKNIYVFLGTGIAAGFSEQLFVGTLEKMAEKLDIIGNTDDDETGKG